MLLILAVAVAVALATPTSRGGGVSCQWPASIHGACQWPLAGTLSVTVVVRVRVSRRPLSVNVVHVLQDG